MHLSATAVWCSAFLPCRTLKWEVWARRAGCRIRLSFSTHNTQAFSQAWFWSQGYVPVPATRRITVLLVPFRGYERRQDKWKITDRCLRRWGSLKNAILGATELASPQLATEQLFTAALGFWCENHTPGYKLTTLRQGLRRLGVAAIELYISFNASSLR
jgi:hypothetical protein